jgi:hypothetical protein
VSLGWERYRGHREERKGDHYIKEFGDVGGYCLKEFGEVKPEVVEKAD